MSIPKIPKDDRCRLYYNARVAYYDGSPILTDEEYDALEETLIECGYSNFIKSLRTGAPVRGTKLVQALDVPQASLNKVKDSDVNRLRLALTAVRKFGLQCACMPKWDGSSVQAVYRKGKLTSLITRGNGKLGKNVSHLIPYLNIPKHIDSAEIPKLVLRMEANMPKSVFANSWSGVFESSRAVASGLLNRETYHDAMEDLDFRVLRVMYPRYALTDGIDYAKRLGFLVTPYKKLNLDRLLENPEVTRDALVRLLENARNKIDYLLDGLVLCSTSNLLPEDTDENPKFAFSFKVNDMDSAPVVTIRHVRWSISSFGVLIPTAIFDPVVLGESKVSKATLHNGVWAKTRNVGVGSKIKVLKSGDIIPHVVAVVKSTSWTPPPPELGEYVEDGALLRILNPLKSPEVRAARIARFFKTLEVDGFAIAMARKMVAAGFDSVPKVLRMTEDAFRRLDGIKDSAVKHAATIQSLKRRPLPLAELAVASGKFTRGVGIQRIRAAEDSIPNLYKLEDISPEPIRRNLVIACGPQAADNLVEDWSKFRAWLRVTGLTVAKPIPVNSTGPLAGHVGLWTGYRDKAEEKLFVELGGVIAGSFSSKVTVVFFLADKITDKVTRAGNAGIFTCSSFQPWVSRVCKQFEVKNGS